jgi:hypothetical protein
MVGDPRRVLSGPEAHARARIQVERFLKRIKQCRRMVRLLIEDRRGTQLS